MPSHKFNHLFCILITFQAVVGFNLACDFSCSANFLFICYYKILYRINPLTKKTHNLPQISTLTRCTTFITFTTINDGYRYSRFWIIYDICPKFSRPEPFLLKELCIPMITNKFQLDNHFAMVRTQFCSIIDSITIQNCSIHLVLFRKQETRKKELATLNFNPMQI